MHKHIQLSRGCGVRGRGRGHAAGYRKQLQETFEKAKCLAVLKRIDQHITEMPPVLVNRNHGIERSIT